MQCGCRYPASPCLQQVAATPACRRTLHRRKPLPLPKYPASCPHGCYGDLHDCLVMVNQQAKKSTCPSSFNPIQHGLDPQRSSLLHTVRHQTSIVPLKGSGKRSTLTITNKRHVFKSRDLRNATEEQQYHIACSALLTTNITSREPE